MERQVLLCCTSVLRSGFEGHVTDVEGALEVLGAFEEAPDGEELEAGVLGAVGEGVEAGFCGFALHGSGGLSERDVDADLSLLAVDDADEVADFSNSDVLPAFDRENDLFRLGGAVVMELEASVDAAIGTLLDSFEWLRSHST